MRWPTRRPVWGTQCRLLHVPLVRENADELHRNPAKTAGAAFAAPCATRLGVLNECW